ncbi:MAG: hypothetical protein WAW37_05600 [Syntrophobacteraceae bacterium]
MNPFLQETFSFTGPLEPRQRDGITIIGPDFFARDEAGKLLSPIATVFPRFRTVITVRGIHAIHTSMMLDFLKEKTADCGSAQLDLELEEELFRDAVALVIRNSYLLIRSDPEDMENIFAADEIVQSFVPKERIQFTGLHLDEVRRKLRIRGESWRMSPAPRSVNEIEEYIRSSRVQVSTGLTVYYNAPTGGRFLTCAEFMRIRPLLRRDTKEALARLREIANLFRRVNIWGSRELSFFLPVDKVLDYGGIDDAIALLRRASPGTRIEEIEAVFDRFANHFAETAGADLTVDDEENAVWRTTMFCRLYDINEHEMETWVLGLSPEFHLNVKWLPGGTVVDGELHFDPGTSQRVRGILSHYWENKGGFVSINLGRVELSQTARDISGEERDVYLVVITTEDGQESIRLVRLMKWDVLHRIKLGVPIEQAVNDTIYYRKYISDRLRAAAVLGFPILSFSEIALEEDIPGIGKVPAFFFDRPYVSGIVTDKIPIAYYKKPEFILSLARLLGAAATFSLVLGRASPRTGKIFFDDGDELIQFDDAAIPRRLVIIETTGSFTNWTAPLISLLPQCIQRFRTHLQKALSGGVPSAVLDQAVAGFADALAEEIARTKELAASDLVRDLFKDRAPEPGGIRNRWEGILARLDATSTAEIKGHILSSPELDFRTGGIGAAFR